MKNYLLKKHLALLKIYILKYNKLNKKTRGDYNETT